MKASIKNIRYCLVILLCFSRCHAQGRQLEAEIKAVENGLRLEYQIVGDPVKTFSVLERMAHYKIPGLSIAFVQDGELRWAKGYGTANEKTGKRVDDKTLFQAGSVSKPIAALAALKLVEEGKLDLDENVNAYLKGWKVKDNEFTEVEKVTLRRILSHNAGVSVHGFSGYEQGSYMPSIIEVLNGAGQSPAIVVNATPGTIYRYSGGGYTIMEKVIEDVTGQPLETYAKEQVFDRLGMNHSTFQQPIAGALKENASAAFDESGRMLPGLWHHYPMQAAAGLWTTPTDLAKYCIEIQAILTGKTNGLLSRKMVDGMLSPQVEGSQVGRGLGPVIRRDRATNSLEYFGHGGVNDGFRTRMDVYPAKNAALIVMVNSDNGSPIFPEINLAFSAYYGLDIAEPFLVEKLDNPPYINDLKSSYSLNGVNWTFEYKNGVLWVDVPYEENYIMVPVGDKEFQFANFTRHKLKFTTDSSNTRIIKIEYIHPRGIDELDFPN